MTSNNEGAFHRVGSLEVLRSGEPVRAKIGKLFLAAFLCEGKVIVTNGRCPHASGPIHEGEVCGKTLSCPWHGWSFDLETGECEEDPDLILERYEASVEGDDILVWL